MVKIANVIYFKNFCDNEHIQDCGFPDKMMRLGNGAKKLDTPLTLVDLNGYFNAKTNHVEYSQINTKVVAFETQNGESILAYYNPHCSFRGVNKLNNEKIMQPTMCANFIYDLNGLKGPNQVGKDIGFMTAFYPIDSQVVGPTPAGHLAVNKTEEYPTFSVSLGNNMCRKKYGDDAKMANIEELKSIFTNNHLGAFYSAEPRFLVPDGYTSSTIAGNGYIYGFSGYIGKINAIETSSWNSADYINIFCVKN